MSKVKRQRLWVVAAILACAAVAVGIGFLLYRYLPYGYVEEPAEEPDTPAGPVPKPYMHRVYSTGADGVTRLCRGELCVGQGSWSTVAGSQVLTAAADDYAFGLDGAGTVSYCAAPCLDGAWKAVPGPAMSALASFGKYVYGVDKAGDSYSCETPCADGGWQKMGGTSRDLAASGDYVYRCGGEGASFCAAPCTDGAWNAIDGDVKNISASGATLFGLDSAGKVFECRAPCANGNWKEVPGVSGLTAIAAGRNLPYAVDGAGHLTYCDIPCEGKWYTTTVPAVGISAF